MNKNKPNANPKQRIKMLIRRIQTQKRIITSLEERNYHLVTELNDTKVALANTTNEYNKLMSKNYEQAVHLNHNQDERIKLKTTMDELDVEAISALKSLGSASEVLLNLKKLINHIKSGISDYKPEGSIVLPSSPFSSRNEISLSDSVEVKRNQAAVSPMVKGYVISNPTITLERLRLNDLGGVIEPGKSVDTRGELSPIPEETTESEPKRTRLGRRGQLPQQFTERAKLNEFIPEAHAEPVVRLSDVSRLLSNTSWLNVNYTPAKDNNTTYSSPSTSSAPSESGINVFSTDTITLRERKKGKRANKISGIDKIESFSRSSENLKIKDSKSEIMGTENKEVKSCEYENSKAESLEPVNKEENTIRFVNSGIFVENSESRNSSLCLFTEINEVNTSKYMNSRKRPTNDEIAKSSFNINDEGTSNKSSSFEESKCKINASVTVNEIEESVGKETIIQSKRNSNDESFSKCKNTIVRSDIESTSKYQSNVLSDKGNDEKMSVRNIEASIEKMGENANNYSIEVAFSKFRNSKQLEYIGNPDVVSSTTANKEETSDEQRSESRGTFLLDNEIDNDSSGTSLVRNSNPPVSREDSIINCTRLLPVLGIATSNDTESEDTIIEQSSMNPTTPIKSSLGVRELQRPRSTRIKKPSIKVLEAVSVDINEGSFQVKRNSNRGNRVSKKNSKCVAESDSRSTNSIDSKTSEVRGTNKRTSSRIKKTVVYRDEPLTKEEMRKILQKGLRKDL